MKARYKILQMQKEVWDEDIESSLCKSSKPVEGTELPSALLHREERTQAHDMENANILRSGRGKLAEETKKT